MNLEVGRNILSKLNTELENFIKSDEYRNEVGELHKEDYKISKSLMNKIIDENLTPEIRTINKRIETFDREVLPRLKKEYEDICNKKCLNNTNLTNYQEELDKMENARKIYEKAQNQRNSWVDIKKMLQRFKTSLITGDVNRCLNKDAKELHSMIRTSLILTKVIKNKHEYLFNCVKDSLDTEVLNLKDAAELSGLMIDTYGFTTVFHNVKSTITSSNILLSLTKSVIIHYLKTNEIIKSLINKEGIEESVKKEITDKVEEFKSLDLKDTENLAVKVLKNSTSASTLDIIDYVIPDMEKFLKVSNELISLLLSVCNTDEEKEAVSYIKVDLLDKSDFNSTYTTLSCTLKIANEDIKAKLREQYEYDLKMDKMKKDGAKNIYMPQVFSVFSKITGIKPNGNDDIEFVKKSLICAFILCKLSSLNTISMFRTLIV